MKQKSKIRKRKFTTATPKKVIVISPQNKYSMTFSRSRGALSRKTRKISGSSKPKGCR